MAVVQLNVLATGQDFAIDDSQIIEVIPINSAADSTLVYEELGRIQKIDVDETASAIATASGTVFSVTAYVSGSSGSTATRYLSAVKCKQLIDFTSFRAIEYDAAGVALEAINVSDSLATLIAAINVSSSDFVTIAGTQTVTGAKTFSAAVVGTSSIKSSSATAGVGYATGAGGTVSQATSKATGVTLSKVCGAITMDAANLAAATIVSFVLTNTAIAATDVLVLNHISGGTVGSYTLNAQCAAGSATINVRNNTAGGLAEAIVIQFVVVKGVNA